MIFPSWNQFNVDTDNTHNDMLILLNEITELKQWQGNYLIQDVHISRSENILFVQKQNTDMKCSIEDSVNMVEWAPAIAIVHTTNFILFYFA